MGHLYLITIEVTPLEVGKTYDELPSHLTLMSRFMIDLSPEEVTTKVRPLFMMTEPIHLKFGKTVELGPKKVVAHMVESAHERALHNKLCGVFDTMNVAHQYPEFIRSGHKAHVTTREDTYFEEGSERIAPAAYLIEIVDRQRVVRDKFELGHVSKDHT